MRRTLLLALLALIALPASALAAKPTVSPKALTLSPNGTTSVEVANPNAYAMRGKAVVKAGRKTLASKSVRLPKRSVSVVKLKLSRKARQALASARNRATVAVKVRRPGSRKLVTATRRLTIKAAGPSAPAPAPVAAPAPAPAPVATPTSFVGRMGPDGPYDDFTATIENGQMTITKPPTVPVSCFENGGGYAQSTSFELFTATGPFPIGTDHMITQQGVAVNTLVSGGERSINYKTIGTAFDGQKATGKLGMSFSHSKLNVFDNYSMTFINCWGEQAFELVPAP